MRLIPRDQIIISEERQRKNYDPKKLHELEVDIASSKGLLHPPCVYFRDGKYHLLTGGRRMKALDKIAEHDGSIACDGGIYCLKSAGYPVTLVGNEEGCELTVADLFEAELHENTHREDLTWQERCEAIATLHKLRLAENPKQTARETATEVLAGAGGEVKVGERPITSPKHLAEKVVEAVTVAANLHNPAVAKARTQNEALALILKNEEETARAILARRRMRSIDPQKLSITIRHGNSFDLMPQMEQGTVDLILTDPPYGIEAGASGFRSRALHHHNYEDDPDLFRNISRLILTEGFRITKPRANIFIFHHIREWHWLDNLASNMGWATFPVPLIWSKSDSEGIRPWGSQGPARTYDAILFATKGQKGLSAPIIDVLRFNRVSRTDRLHAAEKPLDVLKRLIEVSTLPNDLVLDPCAGSGSTLRAAKELGRRAIGIEQDENYHATAMANVFGDDNV